MIVLIAIVELSDQMNTDEALIVGVFDNTASIKLAKEHVSEKYWRMRIVFRELEVSMNDFVSNKLREL